MTLQVTLQVIQVFYCFYSITQFENRFPSLIFLLTGQCCHFLYFFYSEIPEFCKKIFNSIIIIIII